MLNGALAEITAVGVLAVVLWFAMVRPRGLPEAVVAVPGAAALVGLGIVTPAAALSQLRTLGPTVAFLAAILTLAHLADHAGVFSWMGQRLAEVSGGRPVRLLGCVFIAAAVTTAVLSLDATVVLLTPVVLTTVIGLGLRARPHLFACVHLANSASTLFPVSNLTNLLAFAATGLSFVGFSAAMCLPWLAVIAVEYIVFRMCFRADLAEHVVGTAVGGHLSEPAARRPAPVFALTVLALALAGFGVSGFIGFAPVWVAVVGVMVLAVPELVRREVLLSTLVREASPMFCLFVFALGIVVAGVIAHGPGLALSELLPDAPTVMGMLVVAAIAATLANVMNNLPATLVMLGALGSHAQPGLVLAMLIGVNAGPNLTYAGSLANLLWRGVLARRDAAPGLADFVRIGVLTVPLGLVAGVGALWLGLGVLGALEAP